MVRKRAAPARPQEKKLESTNPADEKMELGSQGNSPPLEKEDVQHEDPITDIEKVEAKHRKQPNPPNAKRRASTSARRSERLKNVVVATGNPDVERVIEELILSESEMEDDTPVEPINEQRSLEEKVSYLLQQQEAQQKLINALEYEVKKKTSYGECPSMEDITYRSLYIDSQKKVEALMEENNQLSKKLENALGKIEVYEKGSPRITGMLENLKEMVLFSSLTRATEVANASAGAFRAMETSAGLERNTSTKRKKLDK